MIDKKFEMLYEQHSIRIKLLTKEGYFAFFWETMQRSPGISMKDAYEATEGELERQFNQSRYTSYESFMNHKSRFQRQKRRGSVKSNQL